MRTLSLILILFISLGANLFAQAEDFPDDDYPDTEWDDIISAPYSIGDRSFVISLGILFPTLFVGNEIENNHHGLSIGGTGSLAFNYFLHPHFYLGGEVALSFSATRGGNMLYMVPFGVRAGYQFLLGRFEIPVSLLVGAATQSYIGMGYIGPILKPSASVFWRFNPDWSFGINGAWWVVPQWPENGNNVVGNFMELTLSARYHF